MHSGFTIYRQVNYTDTVISKWVLENIFIIYLLEISEGKGGLLCKQLVTVLHNNLYISYKIFLLIF